jgi:hypothetical protein
MTTISHIRQRRFEARNMLSRRERRKEGTGEVYVERSSPNSVLVRDWTASPCVEHALYIDFHPEGKVAQPEATQLAKHAIESVKDANAGMDGITYLKNSMPAGVDTPLTAAYRAQRMSQTHTGSLEEALREAQTRELPRTNT